MSDILGLLLFLLSIMAIVEFFASMAALSKFLTKRAFLKKMKKSNGRWIDLNQYIPKIDSERKIIDGEFYKEGKYIIIRSDLCTLCIEDRSIVKFATRLIYKRHCRIKVFSSNEIIGKLVFSRSHASRYINSFWYGYD
jgi:hypothetical protein